MTMDTIHWKEGGLGGTIYRTQGAKALAYILEPEPVTDKVASVAEELSLTLVSISGMDWNRDLSPWKAEKVFKGEEDFSGGADDFMEKLEQEVFPAIEEMAGPLPDHRMMAGISLSGLFALYMGTRSSAFSAIASISGSLWFDGFTDFVKENGLHPAVKRVYLSLGDREKKTGNPRMARVESATLEMEGILKEKGVETVFQMNRGNHFVYGAERLEEALRYLMTGRVWKGPHSL